MAGGRPRKHKALHDLEGNPSKRDAPDDLPLAGVPECPETLDAVASAHFNFVTAELASVGVVKRLDTEALSALASAWSDIWRADEAMREAIDDENWGLVKETRILKYTALRTWASLAAKFCLTPSDRMKIMAAPKSELDETESRFFKVTG